MPADALSREVVISLRVAQAAGNAAEFRRVADQVKGLERTRVQSASRASATEEKIQKEQNRRTIGILKDQEKMVKERERTEREMARRSEAAWKRTETVVQAANRKQRESMSRLVEGSRQAAEGIMSMARGFVLLGAASEKDLKVAMEYLMKVQAVVDIGRGLLSITWGLSRAYQAYSASVKAAALGQVALNLAQGAGGVTAGGAAAGGAGRAAVGGVAGGAAGAGGVMAAGKVGGGAAAALPVAGIALAGAGLALGTIWTAQEIAEMVTGQTGPKSVSGRTAAAEASMMEWTAGKLGAKRLGWMPEWTPMGAAARSQRERERADRAAAEREKQLAWDRQLRQRDELRFGAERERLALRGLSAAEVAQAGAEARYGPGQLGRLKGQLAGIRTEERIYRGEAAVGVSAAQAGGEAGIHYLAVMEKIQALRKAGLETEREIGAVTISTAQRAMQVLAARATAYRSLAEAARAEGQAGAAKWGALDPGQRAALMQWRQQLEGPGRGQLTEEQLAALEQASGGQVARRVQAERRRRGEAAGYAGFEGAELEERQRAAERLERGIEQRINVKQDLVVRVQQDLEAVVERVTRAIEASNRDMLPKLERMIDDRLRKGMMGIGERERTGQPGH